MEADVLLLDWRISYWLVCLLCSWMVCQFFISTLAILPFLDSPLKRKEKKKRMKEKEKGKKSIQLDLWLAHRTYTLKKLKKFPSLSKTATYSPPIQWDLRRDWAGLQLYKKAERRLCRHAAGRKGQGWERELGRFVRVKRWCIWGNNLWGEKKQPWCWL